MLIATPAAVLQALQEGVPLDRIYLMQQLPASVADPIRAAALRHQVPVQKVPVQKLDSLHVPGHEGCVAQRSRVQYQQLQDVIDQVNDRGDTPLLLLLDGITDIRNIGAIARTALCCGVQAIIIPERGVGALNEDAMLTSAGALEQIAVCRVPSLMKAVDTLHLNGIAVYASEMTATQTIGETDFTVPCAVVMGSEENGIHPALMKICDTKIRIPMHGNFESLNVSVAAGMILYEAMRQRMALKP
ncbi:MAG: 23S rRNA (guanosine(2251)-2'-O)-methyltransferase RlmB [Lacibacter sp.]